MTTGLYEKPARNVSADPMPQGFGGWLAVFWTIAALLVIWHVMTVTGSGAGLLRMFETPGNAALMRVVVWLKVWLWAPFLILAPLGHRLMPSVTVVTILTAVICESAIVLFLPDLPPSKSNAILIFNAALALSFIVYLTLSGRVAAIRQSSRPVDVRARRHFTLLVFVAGGVSIAVFGAAPETATDRVSIVTAYQFMILMMAVLTIGPLRTMRTGRTAVNIHVRRDIAIWLGISGMLHFFAGTVQSMNPRYVGMYVELGSEDPTATLRPELFMWAVVAGIVILLLLMLLLALSNDRSIIRVGKRWWKRIHRMSYVIFLLTIAHAFAFQFLEYRARWLVIMTLTVALLVVAVQGIGFASVRRKRRRRREARR